MQSTANLATFADDFDLLRDKSPNMKNYIDELQQGNVTRVSTATSYTALSTDWYIGVTSTAAARTITLPAPVAGKLYIIKDESGGAATNNITVVGTSGNIDGAANKVINTNYGVLRVTSDGTNWFTY